MAKSLKVTVSPKEFSDRSTDVKLELIYQAVTVQQGLCVNTVNMFKDNCTKYDGFIKRINKQTRINKKLDLGIGIGVGSVSGLTLVKFIEFIKEYFFGAN